MITNWGYEILSDSLPQIISVEEFNYITHGKYANDVRVPQTLAAVTASIRNYCGWHVAGNVECSITYLFDDLHITRMGGFLLIQLPSRCATEITKIMINDEEIDSFYFLKSNGILKIFDSCSYFKTIEIHFMSGVEDDSIKGLVVSRVINSLNGIYGISKESAGGVSISYSSEFSAGSNPSALLTADKEILDLYKIKELL